jgi:hypothetical protein
MLKIELRFLSFATIKYTSGDIILFFFQVVLLFLAWRNFLLNLRIEHPFLFTFINKHF